MEVRQTQKPGFFKLLDNIRLLLVSSWLGSAIFFSFAVAQSAFAVLPSRELAGAVVNRNLLIINISGLIIGVILLLLSFLIAKSNVMVWIERVSLILLSIACAVGQFVIATWMSVIRNQVGKPIEEVALEDPLRIRFNQLHEYSVIILAIAMVMALICFFTLARQAKNVEN